MKSQFKKGVNRMTKISLEAARVNAGFTQREFAKELGVAHTTVVNWEKGNTEPNMSQLRKISELSGIPMDFIFVPDKSN
jgi:DNA-binding XRE family transcriptional regulator